MKQKIQNALEQEYKKRLGLSDEALERAATFGATFITSEEQIAAFITAAEPMLKAEQSAADRVRTELSAKIKGLEGEKADLEAKLNGNHPTDPPKPVETPDFKSMFTDALAEVVNPLKEELAALKGEKASEVAVKTAQEQFFADEWVNGYPELRDAAWQQAMDVYEDTERKYTAEQLHEKAMKYFKPLAKAKGLDISQPFQSDGAGGDNHKARFEEMAKRQEERQGAVAAN